MEITSSVVVKSLNQTLDRGGVADFRREMQQILRADQPRVVLDFGSVTHLDSAGVETLLHSLSAIVRRGGELKLAALSPQAGMILEMSRVSRFFEIFSTVEDAVASFDSFVPGETEFADPWNMFSNSSDTLPPEQRYAARQS